MSDESIKLINGMLDVDTNEFDEEILILRGVIDPVSLDRLQVDDYQREMLPATKIKTIMEGIKERGTPDIVLGMRGEAYIDRQAGIYLQDPVYIIDGFQRVSAAKRLMAEQDGVMPRIGMLLHFNTDYAFEKALFDKLNAHQTRLSSNITLRNMYRDMPAMGALYKLSNDRGFVLQNQITWGQNMKRKDLITAVTYIKIAAMLHSHAGPGRSNGAVELARGLEKIKENIGQRKLVENVRVFFETVDQCWSVGQVFYRGATHLKSGFLIPLARVFSDHAIFWNDDQLAVDQQTKTKLQKFPINDHEVSRLSSGGGMSGEILYRLLVDHINSGRRTRRLVPRRSLRDRPLDDAVQIETEDE